MLIEKWNGTAWSVVLAGSPPGAEFSGLSGIACRDSTTCFAVGSAFDGTVFSPLAMRWNGTGWSRVPSPNPAGGTSGTFVDIACSRLSACFVVGSYISNTSHASEPLVEQWNGTAWSVVASPKPPGTDRSMLKGVSCGTGTSCFAVGRSEIGSGGEGWRTLIEHWNGATWTIVPSPNVAGHDLNDLAGVSCWSASRCIAVGHSVVDVAQPGSSKALVERWDGTTWSIFPAADPGGTTSLGLAAVSCPETGFCIAVGDYARDGRDLTLIEQWNGTSWSVVYKGGSSSRLRHVSCASPESCFAVGDAFNGSTVNTLIERWNGSSWSVVASPNPGSARRLSGVSCPTATMCMAVGEYVSGTTTKTLAVRWNGTAWSIVASPNVDAISRLLAVHCPSVSSCFAVGSSGDAFTSSTLIERWNGTSWSVAASPNSGSGDNILSGIACPTTSTCFAVGTVDNFGTSSETVVERWNGTSWSIVPSPNSSDDHNHLDDVTCTSATNCFAVGGSQTFFQEDVDTLIERWNGTSWSMVASPNVIRDRTLSGVSCVSATNCVAVGTEGTKGFDSDTLVEAWNGASWSVVPSSNAPGAIDNDLSSVACRSTTCFAVGSSTTAIGEFTLVERNS